MAAQAATVTSVKEVDYSYELGGCGDPEIGISTNSPFSITWTNIAWTNAFQGVYLITATAYDNLGGSVVV